MVTNFSHAQKIVLDIVQGNLPDSPTPYADIARKAGMTEEAVLDFLRELKHCGTIRRFGASIRHQHSGWSANAMVAWMASEDEASQFGPLVSRFPAISHAYYRPSNAPDWPYTLYTMIHGRTMEECLGVVEELKAIWPFQQYAILNSLRELKKTSMRYFRG